VQPYKVYPGKDRLQLPDRRAAVPDRADLFDLIDERQSRREYDDAPLTLSEIGTLLAFTYGVTREASVASVEEATQQYRAVPSPGALYPLEQYLMLFNAEVEPGLYHYRPDAHTLERLQTGDFRDAVDEASFASATMALDDAGGIVLTTAVFERILVKYGDRGYRFVCIEAGLAAQNLSLVGEALDVGTCMVGGYKDDAFHDLLDVDGTSEALLNLFVIGSA
jgi:SagB-type dehydrogenase family enzyme